MSFLEDNAVPVYKACGAHDLNPQRSAIEFLRISGAKSLDRACFCAASPMDTTTASWARSWSSGPKAGFSNISKGQKQEHLARFHEMRSMMGSAVCLVLFPFGHY
jgi:hypothetical protein